MKTMARMIAKELGALVWVTLSVGLGASACGNDEGGRSAGNGGAATGGASGVDASVQGGGGATGGRGGGGAEPTDSAAPDRGAHDSSDPDPEDGQASSHDADVNGGGDGAGGTPDGSDSGLKLTFEAISDTHISATKYPNFTRNFKNALQEIKSLDPTSSALVISGDITELGTDADYDAFLKLASENPHPDLLFAIGNHDVRGDPGGYPASSARFKTKTGMPGVFHDKWVGGYHFVFLGTEQDLKDDAFFSPEQLTWLRGRLSENAAPNKPIFLFCHQALSGTVAKGGGILQKTELEAILTDFPQTIFITAHSHSAVETPGNLYDEKYCTMINDGACAYVDKDQNRSEGLFLSVYGDRVEVRARDFNAKTWVWEATVKLPHL